MESSRIQSLTLVAALIGAAVLGSEALSIGFGASAVGDVAILLALFAFDGEATRSGGQSIAFAGVTAFCLLTPLMFLGYTVLGAGVPVPQPPPGTVAKLQGASPWIISTTWLITTLMLFAVDRFRMSSQDKVSLAESGLGVTGPMKPIVVSASTPAYHPAPIRVAPVVHQPAAPPPTVPQPAEFVQAALEPDFSATTTSAHAIQQTLTPQTPLKTTPVQAVPPGREAIIYLNLVGEGLNVLRTVRAENLGRDYYRIADVMPEGEQWEFTPGQVVKCRKKSLSNGKQMVAFEEAPRAQ